MTTEDIEQLRAELARLRDTNTVLQSAREGVRDSYDAMETALARIAALCDEADEDEESQLDVDLIRAALRGTR
jgi:hypothetical protein